MKKVPFNVSLLNSMPNQNMGNLMKDVPPQLQKLGQSNNFRSQDVISHTHVFQQQQHYPQSFSPIEQIISSPFLNEVVTFAIKKYTKMLPTSMAKEINGKLQNNHNKKILQTLYEIAQQKISDFKEDIFQDVANKITDKIKQDIIPNLAESIIAELMRRNPELLSKTNSSSRSPEQTTTHMNNNRTVSGGRKRGRRKTSCSRKRVTIKGKGYRGSLKGRGRRGTVGSLPVGFLPLESPL